MKQPTLGQRKMNSPFVVEAFNPLFCVLHRWIRPQQEHGHVFTHVGQHMTTARIVTSHEYGYNYYGQVRQKFTRSKMSCLSKFIQNNSTTDIDFRPHYLHCIRLKCLIWRRKFSNFVARYVKSEQYGEENNPYCSIAGVFPATARIQWLVHVLANTIKSNGKHFTVTR